jgi:hypothetical protein
MTRSKFFGGGDSGGHFLGDTAGDGLFCFFWCNWCDTSRERGGNYNELRKKKNIVGFVLLCRLYHVGKQYFLIELSWEWNSHLFTALSPRVVLQVTMALRVHFLDARAHKKPYQLQSPYSID